MSEGFLTSLDTTMLFFRVCRRYGINDVKGRTDLLRQLVARKKAKYLRDAQEFIQGKNVMVIKQEKK